MIRLAAGSPDRYYVCVVCGLLRVDRYSGGAIARQEWHNSPDTLSSDAARQEAGRVLMIVRTEQLELF